MNKIFKVLAFQILFFIFISDIFAFDANIQLDKTKTDINDYINLKVEVNSDIGGQIGVTEIKGIENFDIINQSQSQSSASNVVIVNGKTETKTESKVSLDLTLKAKNKGDFEIGPAILSDGSGEISTNTVKITVIGDDLFINNNHLNINTQNNSNTQNTGNTNQNNLKKEDKSIGNYDNIEKRDFSDEKSLYLLLVILILISFAIYLTLKKNPELLEKIINKNNDNKDDNKYSEKEYNKENVEKIINKNIEEKIENNKVKVEKIFEKDNREEIINENIEREYPDTTDNDFIAKIDDIFKQKLGNKYKIKHIENKTYKEISEYVDIDSMESFESIVDLLNKAKYSNQPGDNEKILALVEKII